MKLSAAPSYLFETLFCAKEVIGCFRSLCSDTDHFQHLEGNEIVSHLKNRAKFL